MPSYTSSSDGAWMSSDSMSPRGLRARCMGVVHGAIASRSMEKPKTDPCFSITPMI
jgi:hypothetical protein